ncbi:hypothetical protein KKE19_01115 [Patescibacteria group bacterium]|nr:hypothetical protein [Patescibacteria group bacterium]MBU4367833.1 hypothetical protein [Patescibacteria group bacterium]MBU4462058.1 hypothetical protein [Patescibacteria group bacterium]MCG2700514.1 hypothetical protein [Candidatus Parcubacteria bacterium]
MILQGIKKQINLVVADTIDIKTTLCYIRMLFLNNPKQLGGKYYERV